jgi:hypothetical protein
MLSVLCVAGTGLTDRIVRLVEREQHESVPSPLATHTALAWGPTGVEAVWPRVETFDVSAYANATVRTYSLDITSAQEILIQQKALSYVGDWYDVIGLLKIWLYVQTGHLQHWLEDNGARIQCAALAVECLRAGSVNILPGVPSSNCTPVAVEQWLMGQ